MLFQDEIGELRLARSVTLRAVDKKPNRPAGHSIASCSRPLWSSEEAILNSRTGRRPTEAEHTVNDSSGRWQLPVGLFVALGCLVTAGYAVVETFWG